MQQWCSFDTHLYQRSVIRMSSLGLTVAMPFCMARLRWLSTRCSAPITTWLALSDGCCHYCSDEAVTYIYVGDVLTHKMEATATPANCRWPATSSPVTPALWSLLHWWLVACSAFCTVISSICSLLADVCLRRNLHLNITVIMNFIALISFISHWAWS